MSEKSLGNDTFVNWMKNQFSVSELKDTSQYGCVGGFSGLIYYSETCKLYRKYEDEIWEMLAEDAENSGQTILEYISNFNGAKNVGTAYTFENLLTWYAAERIATILTESE